MSAKCQQSVSEVTFLALLRFFFSLTYKKEAIKILPKYVNDIWAHSALITGNECPVLVLSLPDACSLDAQCLFKERTTAGQTFPDSVVAFCYFFLIL